MNSTEVAAALHNVFDPELGIDIVSLGLVYAIWVEGDELTVVMTTTSPHCPMGAALFGMTEDVLGSAFPAANIHLGYANSPPWNVHMAEVSALRQLGLVPAGAD